MKSLHLDDKYTAQSGRVYATGSQVLVRLPMMQHQRDKARGLNTAGFISGYRGSPLGVYDLALWQAQKFLAQNQVHFEPGVNEDLAATSVWGSQQVRELGETPYDGVFAMWYGKGPGVDRSGDPLKHGNLAGAARHGGVLVLCGDDHAARSSTTAHQSDHALVHFGMPILNPATTQEYLDLGLYGFALSRYSGCWVGFKCVTDTVEASASVAVDPERVQPAEPQDYTPPPGGLNLRMGVHPLQAEQLMLARLEAARAFVRANRLDRVICGGAHKRLGIISSGKACLDVMDALRQLGLDENDIERLGIAVYQLAMSWPVEPRGLKEFAAGCRTLFVVEEKRPVIEEQLGTLLYKLPQEQRPVIIGKQDAQGAPLLSSAGELSPGDLALQIAAQVLEQGEDETLRRAMQSLQQKLQAQRSLAAAPTELVRQPSFCAGCPHNTSTHVPEGSVAMGGIGCHGLAVWLPERRTLGLTHMGGEGASWIGQAPFVEREHIFQNLGDGTYFHSGLLAIRANVAAKTNITYKILVNGAIAMTGGQLIEGESFDGAITAPHVARQVRAEGVQRIALVSDEPQRHADRAQFPPGTSFHHRDALDAVQREIRQHKGVSVIIYEQACATERRRLRKRGKYPDVDRRLFIHEEVCEGCGDCGVQSNCIALDPSETTFGRKRKINQSVCNKDFSCVKGLCPSFVTVYGGKLRSTATRDAGFDDALLEGLPEPVRETDAGECNILVAGIGGSGIITLGALLGAAAHIEEKPCSVLDITGLAQRNGAVTSHVRFTTGAELRGATRIPEGGADLVLAADLVVAAGAQVLPAMAAERTAILYNSRVAPTSAFARNADLSFETGDMEQALQARTRAGQCLAADAAGIASLLLGDAIGANLFLLGAAWQRGWLPLSRQALQQAIELNGAAVQMNLRAFGLGRLSVTDPQRLEQLLADRRPAPEAPPSLERLVEHRSAWLRDYQNAAYAQRYRTLVDRVAGREAAVNGTAGALTRAVARCYAKLLAYKDEYEVARLYSRPEFRDALHQQFDGAFTLGIHLAPPLFSKRDPHTGRYRKTEFGPWIFTVFRLLARLKFLRGTALNPFGYSRHRKLERRLVQDYEALVQTLLEGLRPDNHATAVQLASLPEQVRGYDVVKEQSLRQAAEQQAALLVQFSAGARAAEA